MDLAQGEVWDVAFSEEGSRPGIIVTRDELNQGHLILTVPCTSSRIEERKKHPNCVIMEAGTGGLTCPTAALLHLIQPVHRDLFVRRRGLLPTEKLGELLQALAWTVDLFPA